MKILGYILTGFFLFLLFLFSIAALILSDRTDNPSGEENERDK